MELKLLNPVEQFIRDNIVGTLAEIEHTDINLNLNNLVGDKAVMVDVTLKNGKIERMFCSHNVSEGLRKKTITKGNLLTFPIAIATRDDGSTFYQIQMPSNSVVISLNGVKAEEYKPVAVSYTDLIA